STLINIPVAILGMGGLLPGRVPLTQESIRLWLLHCLFLFGAEFILFWNGMLRVYLSSQQLGIRLRVIGVICGFIPIANLVVLFWIIRTATDEVRFENQKLLTDRARCQEQLCATRYPILMVHGVFFRDFRYFNYWGRIPQALEANGAKVYYGNHQSAAPVAVSSREIADRILAIVRETGCEKVNVIAHSKGGLDTRAALQLPGIAEHVASLTTVNTPHRGCEFADYLLTKIPQTQQQAVASAYNTALKKLGDPSPDFLGAVTNLTASFCRQFNEETPDVPGVYYQSVGSRLSRASGGRFPLNFTHVLCQHFDGPNDGLVGERSFPWGTDYQFLTVSGVRGISHGDMIDLNRENTPDFDVREFYVQLIHNLKKRGF
ncbi:MAG: triacylglycerol lipase, partial [Acetatifactor sp.]|nr:triacylglycerol lipase [Acetatifactor sp.]